jgi:hypothetical protein
MAEWENSIWTRELGKAAKAACGKAVKTLGKARAAGITGKDFCEADQILGKNLGSEVKAARAWKLGELRAPGQKRWKVKVLGNGVEKALGQKRWQVKVLGQGEQRALGQRRRQVRVHGPGEQKALGQKPRKMKILGHGGQRAIGQER